MFGLLLKDLKDKGVRATDDSASADWAAGIIIDESGVGATVDIDLPDLAAGVIFDKSGV